MPILSSVHSLWYRIAGKTEADSVGIISQRFVQLFADHGVGTSQIPRLFPQLKLDELQSPSKLLSVLTPELLDQAAQLFGVRSQWLEGIDDEIYSRLGCYKEPEKFLQRLAALPRELDGSLYFPLRVLSVTKNLDRHSRQRQPLVPVLLGKITELGEEPIYRYQIFRDGFDWGYAPGRIELKALTKIVFEHFQTPVPLFVISPQEMTSVMAGQAIPRPYLDGCLLTDPSMEDYVLTNTRSVVAKEVDEIPEVLRFIDEHQLRKFAFELPTPSQPEPGPQRNAASPIKEGQRKVVKAPGKRAVAEAEVWGPVRIAAQTLWAQDKTLPITEVVRRIKQAGNLKASSKSQSGIHKRIADLAPEGIAGKSGRKPKQSS